ncbi:hypothetical protein [Okeania sp. SIO2B3]|uniref:hypothetical protein n=1 Tax=Okeania sp. SIO2B3 TaxID=2607784 RepID=UPI0013C1C2EC|nr:hypothetical protein [Okeania sp. SIO2B3]NET45770.1 hypothetical protein [Okeania sp. SIO2B3]
MRGWRSTNNFLWGRMVRGDRSLPYLRKLNPRYSTPNPNQPTAIALLNVTRRCISVISTYHRYPKKSLFHAVNVAEFDTR